MQHEAWRPRSGHWQEEYTYIVNKRDVVTEGGTADLTTDVQADGSQMVEARWWRVRWMNGPCAVGIKKNGDAMVTFMPNWASEQTKENSKRRYDMTIWVRMRT